MGKSFGGLVRIERLYNESGIWTLMSLAQYRRYSVTPVRVDRLVVAEDNACVLPLNGATFLTLEPETLAWDDPTVAVISNSYIVQNTGGTVA